MEIEVNNRKFQVRELLNKEVADLPQIEEVDSPQVKEEKNKESIKRETILSTGMTSEEYDKLTRKEFLSLRLAILKINTPDQDFLEA